MVGTDRDVRTIALLKDDGHAYIFRFTPKYRTELLRTFGRYATRPDLSFSRYDAAVMSGRVKKKAAKAGGDDD